MLTLAVAEWIGNAAAVVSGVWGAVTQRSEQSGSSRTALDTHAQRVVQVVANEQSTGLSYEALWAEHERLRAEKEALWEAWSETEDLSEAQQRELASAGSAMGLSLSQSVIVLAMLLPSRMVPSRAMVGRWVQHSAQPSRGILKILDRVCQGLGLVLCLDAIFFPREPLLMGVEPTSWAWWAGQRGPDRSGRSWCKVIEPWPSLEHVVADGGTGLENGVKLAHEQRQAQAEDQEAESVDPITMGLDVFHSQRELERVQQRQWKQAEPQMEVASKVDTKMAKLNRRGQDTRGVASHATRAWRQAERLFDEAVQSAEVVEQVKAALGWFDADGHLLSRGKAQEQRDKASAKRSGSQWGKARRLLRDARTLSHVDRLEKELAEVVPEPMLRESLTRLWFFSRRLEQAKDEEVGRLGSLVAMEHVLCDRLCPQWHDAYREVDEQLRHAIRASSAVEGVKSVVRMHQGRHRHVSQEMLDLKRLYGNCRVFREGKRKERSPYELLGLKLPTSDWWQLLQMNPQELEQKLLTQ